MRALKAFQPGCDLPRNHLHLGSIGNYLYRTIWLRSNRVDFDTREVVRYYRSCCRRRASDWK
jgi:hypothetical protein